MVRNNLERKESYNQTEIQDAVSELESTKSRIKNELNPERYYSIIETIEKTIASLNDADDLIPFREQITEQIIKPVNKNINKSSTLTLVVAIVLGITGVYATYQSSRHFISADMTGREIIVFDSSAVGTPLAEIKDIQAIIYPEDIKLTIDVLKKYVDKEHILSQYRKLDNADSAITNQKGLEYKMTSHPFTLTKTIARSGSSYLTIGIIPAERVPPKQVFVHPYQLEEVTKILRKYFTYEEIQKTWANN